ncbi:uncharacterized protein LOC125827666 isoform X1 [Solanum verrucosum]|uniref:uncharacterized protein LOC125827666 isoform X1 n=1 Tax=Solanum verrucosum TaxID=315347 RepID=UPI0020D1E60E|nr:uncharacterized protein LOC125827666 isoform X1 [Solanum verrucosum]
MGQSSSAEQVSPEQREAESIAASTGALPNLQKAFSVLSDPQTNSIPIHSLQKCFGFSIDGSTNEESVVPKEFPVLMSNLSSSIVDLFFLSEKGGISWVEFLKGYIKCSGRTVSSASLNSLLRLFGMISVKAGLPEKLQVVSDEDDCKISGFLLPVDVQMLLSMCWIMWWDSNKLKASSSLGDSGLPDVTHLVLSAIDSCAEADKKMDLWETSILDMDIQLPVAKIIMWALKTVPSLSDCFGKFVHARLFYVAAHKQEKLDQADLFSHDISAKEMSVGHLFNSGRAWAISLTLRGTLSDEISKVCFPSAAEEVDDYLLYRSSLHGKGLNRFWSNIEGYNAPLLILISAHEANNDARRWIIGALIHQGFENHDTFYGTSGSLYSISPVFHVFTPSGKEKNFVYSHLHGTVKYEAHPKPVGLAFGGSSGNERIFVDEDFAKVIVRHHACDKTYHHGPLYPDQGFLPVEASIMDVEVLGLGGKRARDIQSSYKKREELFTEQRRKVDLKTFGNWEDSPEKMMMDMVSDPNRVRREDR